MVSSVCVELNSQFFVALPAIPFKWCDVAAKHIQHWLVGDGRWYDVAGMRKKRSFRGSYGVITSHK